MLCDIWTAGGRGAIFLLCLFCDTSIISSSSEISEFKLSKFCGFSSTFFTLNSKLLLFPLVPISISSISSSPPLNIFYPWFYALVYCWSFEESPITATSTFLDSFIGYKGSSLLKINFTFLFVFSCFVHHFVGVYFYFPLQ